MALMRSEQRPRDNGLRCPSCGHQTSTVKDSRPTDDFTAIRRRRLCLRCGARGTTFEQYASLDDRDAIKRGAELQHALESMPQHQRRLVESLILQLAADHARGVRAAVAEQLGTDDSAN